MNEQLLTIFTPTYNRGYILPKLYESLCTQEEDGYRFEWLIIDDASTDNTKELVDKWINEQNKFDIRYRRQEHGGKHRALNKAFDIAKGEFIFIVDSDDSLMVNAVKLVDEWLNKIKDDSSFAGVAGLRVSKEGKIWGGNVDFEEAYVDATDFERRKYNLLGDKAEIYRTSILRKYKFPEINGEYFVTEDYCWMQIAAAGYKLRWYNFPVYICEYLDDGLTNTGANAFVGHEKNYKGYCLYIKKCLELKPFSEKMLHLREYNKTTKALKKKFRNRAKDIQMPILQYLCLCLFGIPVGYLIRKVRCD